MLHSHRRLPTLARVGIAITLVAAAVAGIVLIADDGDGGGTPAKQAADPVLVTTQDPEEYDAVEEVLETAGIAFSAKNDAARKSYAISVRADAFDDASRALGTTGVTGTTPLIKPIECPAPPGFTATKAANERANNCEDAKSIQSMLITAGTSAAAVKVSQLTDESRPDRRATKAVDAQVYLPAGMVGRWPADKAALAIATAIGTPVENVTIIDADLQTLFDASAGSTPRSKR